VRGQVGTVEAALADRASLKPRASRASSCSSVRLPRRWTASPESAARRSLPSCKPSWPTCSRRLENSAVRWMRRPSGSSSSSWPTSSAARIPLGQIQAKGAPPASTRAAVRAASGRTAMQRNEVANPPLGARSDDHRPRHAAVPINPKQLQQLQVSLANVTNQLESNNRPDRAPDAGDDAAQLARRSRSAADRDDAAAPRVLHARPGEPLPDPRSRRLQQPPDGASIGFPRARCELAPLSSCWRPNPGQLGAVSHFLDNKALDCGRMRRGFPGLPRQPADGAGDNASAIGSRQADSLRMTRARRTASSRARSSIGGSGTETHRPGGSAARPRVPVPSC